MWRRSVTESSDRRDRRAINMSNNQGGFSIKADQALEAAINSMENSVFVQEHKQYGLQPVFLESACPQISPTTFTDLQNLQCCNNAPT